MKGNYRKWLYTSKLLQADLVANTETVRRILVEIDPEGGTN